MRRSLRLFRSARLERAEGRNGPLFVNLERGRLVLNSPNANQSFGSLHRVWRSVFAQLNVQSLPPANVLLLGLGGGSIPHLIRIDFGLHCPITAIEIDPMMVTLARKYFHLDRIRQLTVIDGDAMIRVHTMQERFDLVLVDVFDDLDMAQGSDTMGFAKALRERCSGTLCFNTVGYDEWSDARCDRIKTNLTSVFRSVDEWTLEGVNRVFVAR